MSLRHKVLHDPRYLFACGFGTGLAPRMPGTVGTLMALPLYGLCLALPYPYHLALIGFAFILGCWLCAYIAADSGVPDHAAIVWDEIVAYWLLLAVLPNNWLMLFSSFLLFRLFDIWKPWPIRWFDRNIHGGFGIMLDDLLAALFVLLILLPISYLF